MDLLLNIDCDVGIGNWNRNYNFLKEVVVWVVK